ncbi:unnamed protein product [Cuscuta campestris]|uniref:Uncharacterized protein n=1 Tax=Cuscuta campestris TaxID=132261 RepID=A0A484MRA5_9ASTE|nr:unnamed protein product [Cuscuta campestris]
MESVHYCIREEEEEEEEDDENAYIEINLGPRSRTEKEEEEKKKEDDGVEFRVSYLAARKPAPPDKRRGGHLLPPGNPRGKSGDQCHDYALPETHSKQLLLSSSRKGGSWPSGRAEEEEERGGTERRIMNAVMFKFRCFVMSFPWKAAWRIRSHQPPKSAASAATASSSPSTSARFTPPAVKSPPRHPPTSNFQAAAEKPRSSVLLLGMKLRELVASSPSPSDHGRGGGKPSKSCPASVKSTPLHRHQWAATSFGGTVVYTRDNSVQAAIAHCNKSSGRSKDFSF